MMKFDYNNMYEHAIPIRQTGNQNFLLLAPNKVYSSRRIFHPFEAYFFFHVPKINSATTREQGIDSPE